MADALSISRSGGYEGSNEIFMLPSRLGGAITFSYDHYGIPDSFSIYYAGKIIYSSGMTSGGSSGTLTLEPSLYDFLTIVVSTADEGTAWEYEVSFETCVPPAPWRVDADGGFDHNDTLDRCESSSEVTFGPGRDLMRATGSSIAFFDDTQLHLANRTLYATIGGVDQILFTGDMTVDFASKKTTFLADKTAVGVNDFTIGGLEVLFTDFSFSGTALRAGYHFELPDHLGGFVIEATSIGKAALLFNDRGVSFGGSLNLNEEFSIGTSFKLGVKKLDLQLLYGSAGLDLKLQGKFTAGTMFAWKGNDYALELDLSGDNYASYSATDGVDLVGSLTLSGPTSLGKGFFLDSLQIHFNTETSVYGGTIGISLPVPLRPLKLEGGVTFSTSGSFQVDSFNLSANGIRVPVWPAAGVFLTGVGYKGEGLADGGSSPTHEVTVNLAFLPLYGASALGKATIVGTWGQDQIKGTVEVVFASASIGRISGEATLDFDRGSFSIKGAATFLNGLASATLSVLVDPDGEFTITGSGTAKLGGLFSASAKFYGSVTDDGNLANDCVYISVQGTISSSLNISGSFGWTINLHTGKNSFIGLDAIPSWASSGDSERAAFTALDIKTRAAPGGTEIGLFEVYEDKPTVVVIDWAFEATAAVRLSLVDPNGNIIDESEFAAYGIEISAALSGTNSRALVIASPMEGSWTISVISTEDLGDLNFWAGTTGSAAIDLDVLSLSGLDAGRNGQATLEITGEPAQNQEVQLFLDTDAQGFDGVAVSSLFQIDEAGEYTIDWSALGLPSGTYYLYTALTADNRVPEFEYVSTPLVIAGDADLSLEIQLEAYEDGVARYSITITNDGNALAKDAYLSLSDQLSVDSELASEWEEGLMLLQLGDIAAGASKTTVIYIYGEADTLDGERLFVGSKSHDADSTDNGTALPNVVVPDGEAEISFAFTKPSEISVGKAFTYKVVISNTGDGAAEGLDLSIFGAGFAVRNIAETDKGWFYASQNGITGTVEKLGVGESITLEIEALMQSASVVSLDFEALFKGGWGFSQDTLTVSGGTIDPADLSLKVKVVGVDEYGHQVVDVTVTNNGPGVATSVLVGETLAKGTSIYSYDTVQGTIDQASGQWSVGNLSSGISRTARLYIKGKPGALVVEILASGATDPDSTPGNHKGSEDDQASVTLNFTPRVFKGTAGKDSIVGDEWANILYGYANNDVLAGGNGNDVLIGGSGSDKLSGGYGIDTASYETAVSGIVANLTDARKNAGDAKGDTFLSIENLRGSRFTDKLYGNGGANTLAGQAGNDLLSGEAGNDALFGEDGNDTLIGGAGSDKLSGGYGIDTASYETAAAGVVANLADASKNTGDAKGDTFLSIENLRGSRFADKLYGNSGANTLAGQAGNDLLSGGAGADRLDGGAGNDTASYAMATKGVVASLAKVSLNTKEAQGDIYISVENLTGSRYADTLWGNSEANLLSGGSGNDTLKGEAGNDTLYGGTGADNLYGGKGKDTFVFKSAFELTTAKLGSDTIFDFSQSQKDVIDLSAIDANDKIRDNQQFSFIGTGQFTKKAGQLRYEKAASDTFIYGDTDGDGKANFVLRLDDAMKMSKADFLF